METLEAALATYIDVNLLLAGTAILWLMARMLMSQFTFRYAFTSQLAILKTLILAALSLPLLLAAFAHYSSLAKGIPVTLSDLVLAQYLQGNLDMQPTAIEGLLSFRQNITSQIASPDHPFILFVIYGALFTGCLMIFRSIWTIFKLNNILKDSHYWRSFGTLNLLISDTVRVPFTTRTFNQQHIVIPSSMLTLPTDMKVALAHELQHIRQKDVDWEFAAALLTPLFFWNPAFHILKRQIEELRELSCDQKVLRRGLLAPTDYCQCLLRVCGNRFERPALFSVQIPKVSLVQTRIGFLRRQPEKLLANRVMSAIDGNTERQSFFKVATVAFGLIVTCCLMSFAIQKPNDWSQDRLMLSTIINLDRLEQRNTVGLGTFRN